MGVEGLQVLGEGGVIPQAGGSWMWSWMLAGVKGATPSQGDWWSNSQSTPHPCFCPPYSAAAPRGGQEPLHHLPGVDRAQWGTGGAPTMPKGVMGGWGMALAAPTAGAQPVTAASATSWSSGTWTVGSDAEMPTFR